MGTILEAGAVMRREPKPIWFLAETLTKYVTPGTISGMVCVRSPVCALM